MLKNVAILALLVLTPVFVAGKDKPRQSNGDYDISVAGTISGGGKASVTGSVIKIDADVEGPGGEKGKLSAKKLSVLKNHVTGSGTCFGQAAQFKGRLDVPDSVDEKSINGVRLVCTVKLADGRYFRIAGFINPTGAAGGGGKDKDKDKDKDQDGDNNQGGGNSERGGGTERPQSRSGS